MLFPTAYIDHWTILEQRHRFRDLILVVMVHVVVDVPSLKFGAIWKPTYHIPFASYGTLL